MYTGSIITWLLTQNVRVVKLADTACTYTSDARMHTVAAYITDSPITHVQPALR